LTRFAPVRKIHEFFAGSANDGGVSVARERGAAVDAAQRRRQMMQRAILLVHPSPGQAGRCVRRAVFKNKIGPSLFGRKARTILGVTWDERTRRIRYRVPEADPGLPSKGTTLIGEERA
jgi:hypothetical protein